MVEDPAALGALLAGVYAVASLAQVVVGRLIDRYPLKPLYLWIALAQVPLLLLAAHAQGWWLYAALLGAMIFIFGAIPFTDAMIVRYVDDRMRSRVAGHAAGRCRWASARWPCGCWARWSRAWASPPLFMGMAGIALCTSSAVLLLPSEQRRPVLA